MRLPTDPEEIHMASVTEAIPVSPSGPDDPHFLDLFAALAAPFEPDEVRTRTQGGRTFPYVTARTVMNRLDEVLGPAGWWDEFVPGANSVLCKLSVCLPDGHVLTKSDAGGYAGMSDQGDDDKSGYSDAFKRAAVKLGVGRYLYGSGVPGFVRDRYPQPEAPARDERMPSQARPPGNREADNGRRPNVEGPTRKPYDGPERAPSNGRQLFAWARQKGQEIGEDLILILNDWGKRNKVAGKIVDWQGWDVSEAYHMVLLMIEADPEARGDAYEEALSN
jgi:hypothetical protein